MNRERDCSDEIELKNGRANPFGWSACDLFHNGEKIGYIESGGVCMTAPGYRWTKISEGDALRLIVFVETGEDFIT